MQQAIVSSLPFLGQIVKITTRDGKEYDVKISEELPDNDRVFSIMFRNHTGSISGGDSNSSSRGSRGSNNSNIKPPERPELPAYMRPQVNENIQIKTENKKIKVNKKVDYTKVGSSINIKDITEQPFKLNF